MRRESYVSFIAMAAVALGACADLTEQTNQGDPSPVSRPTAPQTSTTTPVPLQSAKADAPWRASFDEVGRCADTIQFAAFVGEPEFVATWEAGGSNRSGALEHCADLADDDRSEFTRLVDASTSPPTTEPPATTQATVATTNPTPIGDPALAAGCVKRIEWGRLQGDQTYVDIWSNLNSDSALLEQACLELVADDPALGRQLVDEVRDIEQFISTPTSTRPPPRPVEIQPLIPQQSSCDPNYTGCVPIASDVDCAGGSGNGPAYTGRVQVIGRDVYDLDRDGDGIACD